MKFLKTSNGTHKKSSPELNTVHVIVEREGRDSLTFVNSSKACISEKPEGMQGPNVPWFFSPHKDITKDMPGEFLSKLENQRARQKLNSCHFTAICMGG